MSQDSRPTYAGPLIKRGAFYSVWHERWFELHGTKLHYYKSQHKKQDPTTLDLTGARIEKICMVSGMKKYFGFTISGPKIGRTFELVAKDGEKTVNDWIRKILDALAEAGASPSSDQQQQQQASSTNDASIESNNNNGLGISEGPSNDATLMYQHQQYKKEKVGLQDFDLLAVIGRGSFGKVMKVQKKGTNEIYAMKVLKKSVLIKDNMVAHTMCEKMILQRVHHPFIVGLKYAFQTPEKLYFILDFLSGGEIFYHLQRATNPDRRFTEHRAKFYAAELALAINYLHSLDIIYRDMKPENVVLDKHGHACITDFGLAKVNVATGQNTYTFCGTPEYIAPEVLKNQGHGKAADWWSLGVLLYEMITGLPPFYDENTNQMYANVLKKDLKFPSYVSPAARSILSGFLTKDVNKRLGPDFEQVKNHPFFAGIDWDKLYNKELTPPFIPDQKDDTAHFDPQFTMEKPRDSVASVPEDGVAGFIGFTFTSGDSELAKE